MNPLSIFRHLVLLGLAYAALVAETSIMPSLDIGGLAIPATLDRAGTGGGQLRGTAVVVWAAALGFTSDCLRSNGPLGLDLALGHRRRVPAPNRLDQSPCPFDHHRHTRHAVADHRNRIGLETCANRRRRLRGELVLEHASHSPGQLSR